jgi:1-acyl-sn-glycerol-3-phosphate acyltransferase
VLYACVRAVVALALRLFFRVGVQGAGAVPGGPVLLVGNHPNALVDPALLFVVTRRRVTFLAKEPLFRLPLLGALLRGMGALPVYRRQDDPSRMGGNAGTFEAATRALASGGALTLFPEGKSHDAPHLSELKTGAARIALQAARAGAAVKVVPVGLTYADKAAFRSRVLVEVGPPLDAAAFLPQGGAAEADEVAAVRRLTEALGRALAEVTLNLEAWEDLPLARTAEALWAAERGERAGDAERLRRFARGVALLRAEEPHRFAALREGLLAFRHRLSLLRARPGDVAGGYSPLGVARWALREGLLLALGALPCLLGLLLFAPPYPVPGLVARLSRQPLDVQSTVKLGVTLLLAPLWVLLLAGAAWAWGGALWGLGVLLAAPPLALLTRLLLEHWAEALRDARVFLALGPRPDLHEALAGEGRRLAAEVERAAADYASRAAEARLPPAAAP